jgi:hypothetical protein
MIRLSRRPLCLFCCALMLVPFAGCKRRAAARAAAGAEVRPLQLTLHTRADVYALDLGGKTPHEYRDELTALARALVDQGGQFYREGRRLPPAPRVDLELEIHNNTDHDMDLFLGGDDGLRLELVGPGALPVEGPGPEFVLPAAERPVPRHVTLAPGQTLVEPFTRLETSHPSRLQRVYWTQAGAYVLRAVWRLPGPAGPMLLVSNPVRVTVHER